MNISTLLTSKAALGVLGSAGAVITTTIAIALSSRGDEKKLEEKKEEISQPKKDTEEEETFEKRVEKAIEELGVSKDWCKKEGDKYVCEKSKNKEELKKIRFTSKHNLVDEYKVQGEYPSVQIEIMDSKDRLAFPNGVKFIITGDGKKNWVTIGRNKNSQGNKWSPDSINMWMYGGEFKSQNKMMYWVWEEINDLALKVGLKCQELNDKACKLETKSMNVKSKDGNKVTEGAKIDKSKILTFSREKKDRFQGYEFVPKEDIELLDSSEKPITDSSKVTKLVVNQKYQVTRDSKDETKWYLTEC